MSKSLGNVAAILRCLSRGVNKFTDLCREVGLPKSSVHRLLGDMIRSGFVLQSSTNRHYYVGPLVFSLAASSTDIHQHLIVNSQEELKSLRDTTRETVAIHASTGGCKFCLEELESPESLRYAKGKDAVDPNFFGAAGKMLLAQFRDEDLRLLLQRKGKSMGGKDANDHFRELLVELPKIREQGYAESIGRRTPGAASVSVPVPNYFCPLTLSVIAPESRFMQKRPAILRELRKTAKRISAKLH